MRPTTVSFISGDRSQLTQNFIALFSFIPLPLPSTHFYSNRIFVPIFFTRDYLFTSRKRSRNLDYKH